MPTCCNQAHLVHGDDLRGVDIQQHFEAVVQFIQSAEQQLGQDARVLVHCKQGVSRSASCVLAYLMRARGMRLKDAYELLSNRRGMIKPNPGFATQLIQYEKIVFGEASVRLEREPERNHRAFVNLMGKPRI